MASNRIGRPYAWDIADWSNSKDLRFGIRVALALAVILAVGLAAGWLSDTYGPIDPTDPGWKARILNDTGQTVRVTSGRQDLEIAAGDSDIVISPGPGQLHATYTIVDVSGRLLGCLLVDLDKQLTVRVNASSMRPCAN